MTSIKLGKHKLSTRERTKFRIRQRVEGCDERPRISVFRSSKHTYAQIISDETGKTIVSASTLDEEVQKLLPQLKVEGPKAEVRSSKSANAARAVGVVLAKRAKEKNIDSAVFDRNGFVYSGRVEAVAEGVREGGLKV